MVSTFDYPELDFDPYTMPRRRRARLMGWVILAAIVVCLVGMTAGLVATL